MCQLVNTAAGVSMPLTLPECSTSTLISDIR